MRRKMCVLERKSGWERNPSGDREKITARGFWGNLGPKVKVGKTERQWLTLREDLQQDMRSWEQRREREGGKK